MSSARLLQIAPMVDWTNSPFRLLMRLLLPKVKLFTEMLVPQAIIRHPDRYLDHLTQEQPLVLQLGGSQALELCQAALLAQDRSYTEINLNLGCPSPRVQSGGFGACLMTEKQTVLACIDALKSKLDIPVTVKTRIGVDDHDSYAFFADFCSSLHEAGVNELVVHARKAYLKGLNPKQNRSIPPMQYDYVYRLKQELPDCAIIMNGEIKSLADVQTHVSKVDGVMIGRLAIDNPYALCEIHQHLYGDLNLPSRADVIQSYYHIIRSSKAHLGLSFYIKPLFNLYHGTIHAKLWKKQLMQAQNNKMLDSIVEHVF